MSDWFVYVLRCGDGSLYTGITTDVARRMAEHASGGPRAAKYLRGRAPLKLALSFSVDGKSAALSMERWIKAQSKSRKEEIISGHIPLPKAD